MEKSWPCDRKSAAHRLRSLLEPSSSGEDEGKDHRKAYLDKCSRALSFLNELLSNRREEWRCERKSLRHHLHSLMESSSDSDKEDGGVEFCSKWVKKTKHLLDFMENAQPHILKGSVPQDFICPISKEVMFDPVIVVESGMTYDRTSIQRWWEQGRVICPATKQPLPPNLQLTPNAATKDAISKWCHDAGYQLPDPEPLMSAGDAELVLCNLRGLQSLDKSVHKEAAKHLHALSRIPRYWPHLCKNLDMLRLAYCGHKATKDGLDPVVEQHMLTVLMHVFQSEDNKRLFPNHQIMPLLVDGLRSSELSRGG